MPYTYTLVYYAVGDPCLPLSGSHSWLLSEEVDILPSLLLPLAGPEQFEGEEEKVEQLPEDLQYLPDDKQREPDADIRKMLVESVMKVCSHGAESD